MIHCKICDVESQALLSLVDFEAVPRVGDIISWNDTAAQRVRRVRITEVVWHLRLDRGESYYGSGVVISGEKDW